jgi:predicted amidophosphoribosyltransferase
MPRGGGGGFRGGGFGGGGFRGGGFRGGSRSFRVGRVRSSGRPFGRTGSRRTVSRAPRSSSHRRRHYGRPYRRRWWGGYYRPWYRRWWHWHWWWGYPYRPWYYAPVYWGGGLALAIIALLVIVPLLGFAFIPFPFASNATSEGIITYRDTQTLYFNEYWYEKESMKAGQQIQYSMDAIGEYSEVTFIIWDQPFEAFPARENPLIGTHNGSLTVQGDHDYQYLGYFLKSGSTLDVEFSVTGGEIEFFIADANDLNRWNNWETIYPTIYDSDSTGGSYSYTVSHAQDWYIVWYNPGTTPIGINFNVEYSAEGVYDFSDADVLIENVESVPQSTFNVLNDGTWYFFIYFDPFVNPAESVEITFDVSFHLDETYHQDKWIEFQPILLIIGGIIVLLLVIAIVQRITSKKETPPSATVTTTTTPATTSVTEAEPVSKEKCLRCNFQYKPEDVYCTNCGGKITGRDYGVSKITTPAKSKNCSSCGDQIKPGSRFCKNCGAKVEQEVKTHKYFPDERESFFCQLDNEKHPSTDSAYECEQCSRKICGDCFSNVSKTGVTVCPYCKGELTRIQ